MSRAVSRRAALAGGGLLSAGGVMGPIGPCALAGVVGRQTDAELVALCKRIDEIESIRNACLTTDENSVEAEEARDAALSPLVKEQHRLIVKMCEIPARTTAGIVARGRTLARWAPDLVAYRQDFCDLMLSALMTDMMRDEI